MTDTLSAAVSRESWRRNLRGDLSGDDNLTGPRPESWWTGLAPVHGRCPGALADGRIRGLPLPDLSRVTRGGLRAYFENGWTLTEVLFSSLQGEEAFYRPPWHALRHPMVFYYAHPAVLYVNKLRVAGVLERGLDENFEQLFETGVDEMSWDDLSKNDMEWPRISDVTAYRRRVREVVLGVIDRHPGFERLPIDEHSPLWALVMGTAHERIHLETSSVLIRELPVHLVQRPAAWPAYHPDVASASGAPASAPHHWISVPAGDAVIGKPREYPTSHWDNEVGLRSISVPPFEATADLVSNADFHPFVASGAYADPQWWRADGWKWRTFRNAKCPAFWVPEGPTGLHQYRLRLVFDVVDMAWDAPAVVNHHEAAAYAAWRAAQDGAAAPYRLLTEAEHHRIRGTAVPGAARPDPVTVFAGDEMPERAARNTAFAWGSESPVRALAPNALGFRDVFGNVWQWCEDHFAALPGFRVHPYYDDFSSPCFDGEHSVILGGSFASAGDEASEFARFHFRRHFQQHAGFRMVRTPAGAPAPETTCMDAPPPHVGSGPCCSRDPANVGRRQLIGYEARATLDAYLLLHFATSDETLDGRPGPRDALGFPARCGALVREWADRLGIGDARALDVGCGTGGAVFDLARRFRSVLGIDLSASFIDAANVIRAEGSFAYTRPDEGDLRTPLVARVDPAIDRTRAQFRRGDAGALPADLEACDAVLLANLLCRLPSPKACLGRMGGPRGLVRPGGLLVITTPATWREEFTPRGAWLGGYEEDGRRVSTLDGLNDALADDFELLETRDVPFLIREHARKFEYVVALGSIWRRRG